VLYTKDFNSMLLCVSAILAVLDFLWQLGSALLLAQFGQV
jgi:hypothetical protein